MLIVIAAMALVVASPLGDTVIAKVDCAIEGILADGGGCAGGASEAPGAGSEAPPIPVARPAPAPAAEDADDEPSALERLGGGLADFAGGATDLAGDATSGAAGFVADNAGGTLDTLASGAQGAGALLDGALLGDIHGSGYENPWLESLRAVGHTASGVVVLGDARDILFNAGKVAWTGGEGFDIQDEAEVDRLREVAEAGGGEYVDAKTGDALRGYFGDLLDERQALGEALTCGNVGTREALTCTGNLYNQSLEYIAIEQGELVSVIGREQRRLPAGDPRRARLPRDDPRMREMERIRQAAIAAGRRRERGLLAGNDERIGRIRDQLERIERIGRRLETRG